MKRFWDILLRPIRLGRADSGAAPAPASEPGHPVAWSSMASLLEDLEKIGDDHPEIYGTDVRERLWAIADRVLIKQELEIVIPLELGMFSNEANQRLRAALEENLRHLEEVFRVFELNTEAKRLNSFCNPRVRTERGKHVDAFFGHP